jgi:hypothetical protein
VNKECLSPISAITIPILVRFEALVDCDATDNRAGLLNKSWPTEANTGYSIKVYENGALG